MSAYSVTDTHSQQSVTAKLVLQLNVSRVFVDVNTELVNEEISLSASNAKFYLPVKASVNDDSASTSKLEQVTTGSDLCISLLRDFCTLNVLLGACWCTGCVFEAVTVCCTRLRARYQCANCVRQPLVLAVLLRMRRRIR